MESRLRGGHSLPPRTTGLSQAPAPGAPRQRPINQLQSKHDVKCGLWFPPWLCGREGGLSRLSDPQDDAESCRVTGVQTALGTQRGSAARRLAVPKRCWQAEGAWSAQLR